MSMLSTRPSGFSHISTQESRRKEELISREVNMFLAESEEKFLQNSAQSSIAEVKQQLLDRGVYVSDMEYQICDFSETLRFSLGSYHFELSRALFPKKRDHSILLTISEIIIWKRLEYSAENIADYVKAIIDWLPEYESIVANAEVELMKIQKICEIGMAFLQTISDKLCRNGLDSYVLQSFKSEEYATFSISYGNGINCEYKINLLEDFQEKIVEITDRLCCQ